MTEFDALKPLFQRFDCFCHSLTSLWLNSTTYVLTLFNFGSSLPAPLIQETGTFMLPVSRHFFLGFVPLIDKTTRGTVRYIVVTWRNSARPIQAHMRLSSRGILFGSNQMVHCSCKLLSIRQLNRQLIETARQQLELLAAA